ncbi:GDP-mannose 4,6-dehydratase [Variovorax sp.]|uniref:GDP-mannose 4,6-dehydratase n=1 Tax=Variovorax sp. TaxID=1871043 RepID=UPI002D751741|nr:GDP-mannose 4,6-dehydratase [Variovorax sp.]HYP82111.1 GDP-mannose 4,6-dehydratase [Variovorax sp.]
MKLLLTGSNGFTGRPFRHHAQVAGYEVLPLHADLLDTDALTREVQSVQPDYVVHLAGIAFVGHSREEAFYGVNVLGTTNLLDALASLPSPPSMTLLASSANVYGNCAQSPISEDQPPAPVNHYAMSKLAMEYMARAYMHRLQLVVTRPFNYTGPGQDEAFVIPKLAKHFAERAPSVALGNLHVEREFNDVRSVCAAYLFLLQKGVAGEIYNVCSGRMHNLQEIIQEFERIAGHTMDVRVDPHFVRPNEVHQLCGNPGKLKNLMANAGLPWRLPSLTETLTSVLDSVAIPRG